LGKHLQVTLHSELLIEQLKRHGGALDVETEWCTYSTGGLVEAAKVKGHVIQHLECAKLTDMRSESKII